MEKNMKHAFLLCLMVAVFSNAFTQDADPEEGAYYSNEDNAVCFRCHGVQFFKEYNQETDEYQTRKMYKGLIIDSVKYYNSNHRSFSCTDCHSYNYNTIPHPNDLHFEILPACEDCHSGDEAMEKYNFDGIVEEYNKSHHTRLPDYPYSCWSCHEPHSFKMEVRTDDPLTEVVVWDNGMCLQCHGAIGHSDIMLGVALDPIMEIHSWLPGTENHLRHVRCLECHAEIREDVVVAHNILPSAKAINTCEECHSSNSRLLHTLYKFQIQEGRMQRGIFGALATSDIFVVGANRNEKLNVLSMIIFAGLAFVIMVHIFFRIIKK